MSLLVNLGGEKVPVELVPDDSDLRSVIQSKVDAKVNEDVSALFIQQLMLQSFCSKSRDTMHQPSQQ